MIFIAIGCKKEDSEPDPVKQKYVWAVGATDSTNYPLIYFSDNGGENWVRQGEGQTALHGLSLTDVWAIDENNVWTISVANDILKSVDGGSSWTSIQPPSNRSNAWLLSISVFNKTNIWISGTPGIVYKSTDGGNTWVSIQSSVLKDTHLQGIHAINEDIVYVAGAQAPPNSGRGFIARTTNGGQTWEEIVPDNDFNSWEWIGVTSSDPDNIVVFGGLSHYIYSADAGQTWNNDSTRISGGTGGGDPDLNDLVMLNSKTWWSALDNDNIGFTENAGITAWENQGAPTPGPGNIFLVGIDAFDSNTCVIVGESAGHEPYGKIIYTSNGGQEWKLGVATSSRMQHVSFIK